MSTAEAIEGLRLAVALAGVGITLALLAIAFAILGRRR